MLNYIPAKNRYLNLTLTSVALGGLVASVFAGFSIRGSADTFSDLKTLTASAWCFIHGADAYSVANIAHYFVQQRAVATASWYGHAPVYPPTTLALIAPFCVLPMPVAVCVITGLSLVLFIAAVSNLLLYSAGRSEAPWVEKAVLVAACAAAPLLGFALSVGNLSVMATALAVLAFTAGRGKRAWVPAALLALAILLKPHLGIWYAVGMFLLRENYRRAVAVRAAAIVCVFTGGLGVILAMTGSLELQSRGLAAILTSETSVGSSMNISSREPLTIGAQITSLQSLLGLWNMGRALTLVVAALVLGVAAWWLVRATLLARTEEEVFVAVAAWVSFGLLTTYHRAHDATALVLLVPFLLYRIRKAPADWKAWTIIGFYLAMSIGPSMQTVQRELAVSGEQSLRTFAILRQAGIADVCLLLTLFFALREYQLARVPVVARRNALTSGPQEEYKRRNPEAASQ